ncbi:GGDEF domain-containing protein [Cupriavidus basilensis]
MPCCAKLPRRSTTHAAPRTWPDATAARSLCILCPHTDEHQATALANRILRKVRAIPLPGQAECFASVSIGVAQLRGETGSKELLWRTLFADADRALYQAKEQGRDRYVVVSATLDETPAPPLVRVTSQIMTPAG